MLGWLAAAAAPILIHLWMRQTHRETAWAAVRFLRAALEKQARKLRLQHWVLLATRTLLLILLALAAAKPLLDSGLLGAGAPTHRVLVIDASLSMKSLDAEGRTALEKAKQVASSLVDAARAGDAYSLVVMGPQASAPLGRPTSDSGAARRAVEAVAPTQAVGDLGAALASAKSLIEASRDSTSGHRQEVIFLSDLGANTWAAIADADGERQAAALFDSVAEAAEVSVIDVGGSSLDAVAVTSLGVAEGLPSLAAPVEFVGEVRLFAGDPGERNVSLVVDDAVVAQRRVRLAVGSPAAVGFTHRFATPGPKRVGLRIAGSSDDRLRDDDQRNLAMTLSPRVRVLCVAGAPGAADYLADALDPTGEGVYEPVVVSDADLPTVDLTDYACVFLSNVRELSESEAERLTRYVATGGGVALFLGDRVDAARYNDTLAPPRQAPPDALSVHTPSGAALRRVAEEGRADQGAALADNAGAGGLAPGWLSASVAAPSYRVDPLGYEHPIVQPFRGWERAGLLTTPVYRHFPFTPAPGQAEVVLALENGDPLLVTAPLGRGRVAVLTTAATLDSTDPTTGQAWTALPAWPSFLPIVRELTRYLVQGEGAGRGLAIGQAITGVASPGTSEVVVVPPADAEPGRVAPDDQGRWTYTTTDRAGVYLFGPAGEAPTGAVAVNTDAAESDPETVSTDRLPDALRVRRSVGDARSDAAAATPTPLHRWLLYAALGLALIEPAMACWFGRGSG